MTTAETWNRFQAESEKCSSLLNSKLKDSWDDLHELLVLQADALDRAVPLSPDAPRWILSIVSLANGPSLFCSSRLSIISAFDPNSGQLMRLLAESSLELIVPWQSAVQVWLPQLLSHGHGQDGFRKEAEQFRRRLTEYEKQASLVLKDLSDWSTKNAEKIANRIPFRRNARYTDKALEEFSGEYFNLREFWVRQNRAVDSDWIWRSS